MSITRDGSSRVRDRKTSTNLRAEYTDLINADEGLVEARRWIERVTFTKFKNNDFRESLADGVLLCELVVNVASMSIGRINRSSTQYAGIDNIKLFIRACEALGFEKSQLFDADDLQEVPVKRGQSVLDRAKESQQRLRRVALTVYHLGKYANEHLNFTGSSVLKEECFSHLLENNLPELPILEGADLGRRASQYEISQAPIPETTPEKDKKENAEIVTETGNFSAKRNTFQQLEQESIKQAEEEALQRSRRRSFSSGDKENELDSEEALKRRKSLGSKPVWKEGDSRYKHKREILGGWKDPIKSRRERIESSGTTDGSPPKHQITMRSPGDLQKKKSKFEEMERTASEEAEVLQGRRTRPKSWVGGDIRSRSASLKDKTNKFEDMQRQADKESAVLHGELRMPAVNNDVKRHDRSPVLTVGAVNLKDKHSKFEQLDKAAHQQTLVLQGRRDEVETDFTYDIGDKLNGPISLPGAADPKLQDKKKQFETLDYKAQRESTILRLHSGKSFDDPNQNPIPLNTASRRADPKPRPKSNIFDYQRFPPVDIDRREILNEPVQPREMDFSESTPEQWNSLDDHGSSKSVSPTPLVPPRGDSLRYNAKKQDEDVSKSAKTPLYSSFAAQQDPSKDKGQKNKEMKYKEFISYPVVKQRDRVDRYNAAIQGLSKEPPPKNITTGEKPRKKSLNSSEWIKHKAQEEPEIELPKRQIKKIWDREPDAEEEESVKKPLEAVDTSFDERKISTHVANVQNMSYRDFTAAPKNLAKDRVISRAPVVELVSSRKKSENRNEPFSNFAQPVSDDVKNTTKKQSMSYHDFAVPPPKVESKADAAAKAQKVREMTRKFQDLEAEQNKPKQTGPPGLKSLVDRDELLRHEREARARSWYGVDDEEFEGATRRRVRRWSDYEYEEGDRMRDAPREIQNGDANASEVHPSVFDEPEPYRKPIEPEPVRVQETRSVESAKEWYDIRPPPPVPVAPKETEIKPEVTRPVKSILRHDPLTTVNHYEPTQPEPTQPEPAHEQYQTETQPEPNHTRTQPRAVSSHGRTVGSRSWNDFESARRKKSMELLENRPAAKPYETRDTTKVEGEPYKLKRPTDFLPKHHLEQAPKTTRQTNQQPEPQEAHQYNYESQPQNSQNRDSMPMSYPTYYEPDVSTGYSPAAVETGKPLFVSARLHEDDEIQMKQKPTSASPSYDIPVAEKVSPPEVESNVESEPQDFKAQQRLWEYKTTQIHEEPVPPQPDVVKNAVNQPEVHKYVIDPEPVRQRQEEPPKPHRPQVFAIVGTAHPVRPSTTEPVKPVSPTLAQVSPKEPSPQITKQPEPRPQDLKPKLLRSPSGAKVFDFSQENDEQTPDQDRAPAKKLAPVKAEDNTTVVVETVNVVEKGPSLDDDIFQSFNEEEEKMKRNLQDPVYREKLRKEVEEENRKQREETRYLTNLQMGQPLGPNEDNFIHEEEERLRQEKLESISPKKDIYDYNANRKDYPIIEKQVNGLQHSPNEKEIPLYPLQRGNEPGEYDRRYENERGGQLPHKRSGEDRGRNDYQESRPNRERELHENERRKSPNRYPSSERERYEQDRRGRSPHRRQSPGRERQDQERRNRYPSSDRDRYERDQRGPRHRYPSSERDRYEHDRRGRSPHRNRDEYYRENERRVRDPRDPQERRRDQEYSERDRYKNERRDGERREQERRDSQRRDAERREAERIEHERRESERREHERREAERIEAERREQERIEAERRERERIEAERREQERVEAERRERERIEAERREQERVEAERRERERREAERREAERIEAERREHERREAERREQERIDAERREHERREAERREQERIEAERREHERREAERREYERREQERMEKERLERLERERIEKERREQERIAIEQERLERERRDREEQLERERLEKERIEQERMRVEQIERERIEQERIERERREQERIQRERVEHERREQEKIEWERLEQERIEQERYEQQRFEDERRRRGHEQDRYERDRYDRERQEWERRDAHHRGRPSSDYYDDRRKDRREQERYEQERKEQERRDRHRREQEQLSTEERERHRLEQQQRVHEMIANQRQEEIEQDQYKEMLSKEQQYLYGASEKRRNSEDDGMWKKVEDGSGYDIYSTFIEDERSPIVCTSCGMSIVRDRAMYVRELNQYWHETCFRCVVCHVIFGSREQRSPLKVTDSLLHCENCFITNEGDKCTEV